MRGRLPVADSILGGDVFDDLVKEVGASIADQFHGVSEPHHNLLKQEGGCCPGIIPPCCLGFYPLSSVVRGEDYVALLVLADGGNWLDKVDALLYKQSKGEDRRKGPMVFETWLSVSVALIVARNAVTDITDYKWPPVPCTLNLVNRAHHG